MSSSSDSEDDYTNTGSIFGKITEKAKKDIPEPINTLLNQSQEDIPININDLIEVESITDGKRKAYVLEEVEVAKTVNTRKNKRGRKSKSVEKKINEVITLDCSSQNSSMNDSVDVIEQINAALERNRRGRGRRKSVGTPKGKTATPKKAKGSRGRAKGRRSTRKSALGWNPSGPQVVATIELDVDYPILNSNNFISKIDLGEEMTVKVLWKSQSYQKFEVRKKEKLDKLFKYYAEKENVSEELLYFSLDDVIVCKNDTPESLNLNVASIIQGGILSTKTHLSSGYKQNTIELKIQWKNLKRPFIYNMNVTDDMSVLMNKCAKQMNIPLEKLKFCFDGEVIEPDDTPNSLDLEGGECIDCIEK